METELLGVRWRGDKYYGHIELRLQRADSTQEDLVTLETKDAIELTRSILLEIPYEAI